MKWEEEGVRTVVRRQPHGRGRLLLWGKGRRRLCVTFQPVYGLSAREWGRTVFFLDEFVLQFLGDFVEVLVVDFNASLVQHFLYAADEV